MSVEVRELLAKPETIPFSRLKYLARSSEEDVAEFSNELFNLAALAKDEGDWSPMEQFLERWEGLLALRLEPPLRFDKAPWAPLHQAAFGGPDRRPDHRRHLRRRSDPL